MLWICRKGGALGWSSSFIKSRVLKWRFRKINSLGISFSCPTFGWKGIWMEYGEIMFMHGDFNYNSFNPKIRLKSGPMVTFFGLKHSAT